MAEGSGLVEDKHKKKWTNGYGCGHKKVSEEQNMNVATKKPINQPYNKNTLSKLPLMPYCFYFSDKVESKYAPELEKKGWLLAKKEIVRYLGDFKIAIYRYPINGYYYFDIYNHKLEKIFFTDAYKLDYIDTDMILPMMMRNAEIRLKKIILDMAQSFKISKASL